MRSKISFLFLIPFFAAVLLSGCRKELTDEAPVAPLFIGTSGNYAVTAPSVIYKIPIALTRPVSSGAVVSVSSSSPTGAVVGTHYALNASSFNFIGDKLVDTLIVTATYNQYLTGRKDTIKLSLSMPEGFSQTSASEYTLALSGPCFEGIFNLSQFLGDYKNTNEDFGGSAYGPYTTSVKSVNLLTPTTGTIVVGNLYDYGWGDITFMLDWTNPANRTVMVVPQSTNIADASTLGASYAGKQVAVRPHTTNVGTFSACKGTIDLSLQLGVAGVGFFSEHYTVTLRR